MMKAEMMRVETMRKKRRKRKKKRPKILSRGLRMVSALHILY